MPPYADDDVVIARHGAAIDAAAKAGVRHVIYTSLAGSGDHLTIAVPHRWTEKRLAESDFDTTILRNGLYVDVPAQMALGAAAAAAATGVFSAPLGHGTVPVAARDDFADVAAKVAAETQSALTAGWPGPHSARYYELEGTVSIGGTDLAGALTEALGTPVRYEPSPLAQVWEQLLAAGLPHYQVAHSVSIMSNLNAGLLTPRRSDLADLLGTGPRPARPLLAEMIRAGVPR